MNLLNKLKEDRNELVVQLEDEKRKNEDLLFRLEEASITKDDIEVNRLIYSQKINKYFLIIISISEENVKRKCKSWCACVNFVFICFVV